MSGSVSSECVCARRRQVDTLDCKSQREGRREEEKDGTGTDGLVVLHCAWSPLCNECGVWSVARVLLLAAAAEGAILRYEVHCERTNRTQGMLILRARQTKVSALLVSLVWCGVGGCSLRCVSKIV